MKKIILILICLIISVGCENEKDIKDDIKEPEKIIEEVKEPEYVDTNPIVVGLYYKGKLVDNYNFKFKDRVDIATFNVVFTNEKNLGSTNVKNNWKKYYDKYENIDEYKIGFLIEMEVNGEKKESLITDPSSTYKLDPYLYPYLYDAIHAKGKYTHLKMSDMNDNTIFSSIKLYLHQNTKEITSPIKLTVFTYKDDNDFLDGYYCGNSKYTITINNAK